MKRTHGMKPLEVEAGPWVEGGRWFWSSDRFNTRLTSPLGTEHVVDNAELLGLPYMGTNISITEADVKRWIYRMHLKGAHKMSTKQAGVSCYDKAKEDEPLFVLRAQDQSSPKVVVQWILENIETAPREVLHEALECALAMRAWPKRKAAD